MTVEATLLWKFPDRLAAIDARGNMHTWIFKSAKQLGFDVKEGDLVFVHADEATKEVFYMTPKNNHRACGDTETEES